MASMFSNYSGNLALAAVLKSSLFLGLHQGNPTATGQVDTEFAGGGYIRKPITFSSPNGKSVISTNRQVIPALPAGTISYLAIWDSISGGNVMVVIDISGNPLTVEESQAFTAEAGDISITV